MTYKSYKRALSPDTSNHNFMLKRRMRTFVAITKIAIKVKLYKSCAYSIITSTAVLVSGLCSSAHETNKKKIWIYSLNMIFN